MTPAASHVLLLGWDDIPRTGEQPAPSVLALAQTLASHAPVAIVLPRRPTTPITAPNTHVTVLSELTAEQIRAFPARPDHSAGWQAPAAPYVGSAESAPAPPAVPTEPYVGRPTAPAASAAIATGLAAAPAAAAWAAAPDSLPTISPEGGLANHDDFEDDGAEPAATEAHDLSQPQDDLSVTLPEENAGAPLPSLPDGMAALQLTPAPDADLNYQVIQYARLASRQVVMENFAVIYATDWPTWLAAMEIRQQTGRPLVLHVHSLAQDRNTPDDRGWIQELERLTMRRADLVLASSEEVAERLRETYPAVPTIEVVSPTDTAALNDVLSRLEKAWARR